MKKYFTFIYILIQFISINSSYCAPADTESNNKLSIDLQNRCSKKNFLKQFDINKISNLKSKFATIYINNDVIDSPSSIKNIKEYVSVIKKKLSVEKDGYAIFKYENMPEIKIKLPCLGIGRHGMVFEIIDETQDSKKVLKLNIRCGIDSLKAGIQENYNYYFWIDKAKKHSFEVAHMHDFHSYGLYSIKEKNTGISLTEYFTKSKIIFKDDTKNNKIKVNLLTQAGLNISPIKEISQAVLELLDVVKNNYKNCSSISPNNIFVEFDLETNLIKKIELIDYGISMHKILGYLLMTDFNQYIKMSSTRVKKYQKSNY